MMSDMILSTTHKGFDQFMAEVNRYPLLNRREEDSLIRKFKRYNDRDAAWQVITSNIKFVVKIAFEYTKRRDQVLDLVQEGVLGLMIALKKFDLKRKVKFISYAVSWVRACIQNYMMKTWNIVSLGTTKSQRRAFSLRNKIHDGNIDEVLAKISPIQQEQEEARNLVLRGCLSLDRKVHYDSDVTHLDFLIDEQEPINLTLEKQERDKNFQKVLTCLSDKERYVIDQCVLAEEPKTMTEVGKELGVTKQRIEQLKKNAFNKLREEIRYAY
jgi:RNA polymerase sigma-32 factor